MGIRERVLRRSHGITNDNSGKLKGVFFNIPGRLHSSRWVDIYFNGQPGRYISTVPIFPAVRKKNPGTFETEVVWREILRGRSE